MSDQQRAVLAEALSKEVESAITVRRRNRTLWRGSGLGILLFGMGYLALGNATQGRSPFWSEEMADLLFFMLPIAAIGLTFSGPFSVWSDNRRLRELRPAIEALGQLGKPAALASLATAATYDSLQEAATTALTKITAGLRPDDYGTLPLQAVPALCNALTGTSRKTASVILQAFTLIGDGRAIERIAYLASTDIRPEIREAAIALLPILQQRAMDGQASSLLLRASHAPPDGGQTLLRVAHEQPVTDPTQLLRMVSPDNSTQESSKRPEKY